MSTKEDEAVIKVDPIIKIKIIQSSSRPICTRGRVRFSSRDGVEQ
jgi:hypothetical protein